MENKTVIPGMDAKLSYKGNDSKENRLVNMCL